MSYMSAGDVHFEIDALKVSPFAYKKCDKLSSCEPVLCSQHRAMSQDAFCFSRLSLHQARQPTVRVPLNKSKTDTAPEGSWQLDSSWNAELSMYS